ncbi:Uncharacterised protein [Campylobacter hyointestinalis subsp. hyointestinalis]|uniref:Uncharacterized protein n=1 Tax=Campylobacter hyointestinalis subsp. hyointestinalis TaxID=91352 RepID=A0A0S4SXL9_CAMHY|nr:Uncharacterised protein [Campylobacter hyointestinalis subsp. hyointestinalis]
MTPNMKKCLKGLLRDFSINGVKLCIIKIKF